MLTGAALLLLLGLTVSLGLTALNRTVMRAQIRAHAMPEARERLGDSLERAADDLTEGLLAGAFPNGIVDEPLFSAKELAHLDDCAHLVRGLKIFGLASLVTGASICTAGFFVVRPVLLPAAAAAAGVYLLALAAAGLWAWIDFDGFFITFHKLSFSNRLWLLDPERDLLIQMMPLPFFISYIKSILSRVLPVPVFIAVGWTCVRRRHVS